MFVGGEVRDLHPDQKAGRANMRRSSTTWSTTDIGRWMPLGAITILTIYCITTIDTTTPPKALAGLIGVAATIAIRWWQRNAVLSILTGTATYLLMVNWVIPT